MRQVAPSLVLKLRIALATLALATFVLAIPAQAQMPSIGVPKGQLRLEIGGDFATVNGGVTADAWNADLGAAFLPRLAGVDASIRAITGNASYRLSAGRSSVTRSTQVGRGIVHAAVGLSRKFTVFGTLPFVRSRAQTRIAFDTTNADAGINPADPTFGTTAGQTQTANFLAEFQHAIDTLQARYDAGAYDGNPTVKAEVLQSISYGTALRAEFYGLLYGSIIDPLARDAPFIPTATSAAGSALLATVNSMQATIAGYGWNGFTTDPALAAHRLTEAEFQGFLTDPNGPVASTFRGNQLLQRPGDAELGVVYTAVDRPHVRLAATGLVRLPTGLLDRSENFFDLGTGDGQTDLEGRLTADLARGYLGARLTFGYNRQFAAELQRRVATPSQPLAYADRLANVRRDPGDEVTIGLEPFLRLAPGFALSVGAIHWAHGTDRVSYTDPAYPSVPASDLAVGSKRSATSLQAGLSYSSFAGIHGTGTPIEARWAYRSVVSASGGRVDKTRTMTFQFRAYYKLW